MEHQVLRILSTGTVNSEIQNALVTSDAKYIKDFKTGGYKIGTQQIEHCIRLVGLASTLMCPLVTVGCYL